MFTKLTIIILITAISLRFYLQYPIPELDWTRVEELAYNYSKASDPYKLSPPLTGITIAVTGATSGIGKGLSCSLFKLGATVLAVGRSPSKLASLEQHLKKDCTDEDEGESSKRILSFISDFKDLESVSKVANLISSKVKRLDFLINNAGFGYTEPLESYMTVQGYDLCFGVNYLSHFLLSEKLIPLLQKSKHDPKIIQIASSFHWQVDERELMPYNGNDPIASRNEKGEKKMRAYPNSKLAQILHGRALARKYKDINVVSICPGWVRTNILPNDAGQAFLRAFGFPSDGVGLSSTFNAMFLPTSHDFITNWNMKFLTMFVPMSEWGTTYWIRDIMIYFDAVTILPFFQKIMFKPYSVMESSPESYNVTVQDMFYDWSMDAVSKWL